ncbi:protein jag [Pseudomonadota bacterium]
METLIQDTVEELLSKLCTTFRKIRVEKEDDNSYKVNIESEEPSLLIGRHGDNIYALQNVLRIILWNKQDNQCNVTVDIDDYRKRQEENVINLAERKVEAARKSKSSQSLPPMAPYFRRLVHVHLTKDEFNDIETQSVGEGDFRYLTIKPKDA